MTRQIEQTLIYTLGMACISKVFSIGYRTPRSLESILWHQTMSQSAN